MIWPLLVAPGASPFGAARSRSQFDTSKKGIWNNFARKQLMRIKECDPAIR
jgi:hypothetical protein